MGNESILSTSTLWFSLSLLFWCLNCLSPKNLSLFFFFATARGRSNLFFFQESWQSHAVTWPQELQLWLGGKD